MMVEIEGQYWAVSDWKCPNEKTRGVQCNRSIVTKLVKPDPADLKMEHLLCVCCGTFFDLEAKLASPEGDLRPTPLQPLPLNERPPGDFSKVKKTMETHVLWEDTIVDANLRQY